MDYEQKYKEALNWMRSIYPTLTGSDKEDAEHYFPELKESEDDRIRREIIEYLRGDLDDITTDDTDRWIKWIEKQKDCFLVPKSHIDPIGEPGVDGMELLKKQKEQEPVRSKDEKIRKWLVDYFKAVGKSWIHRDISQEQILTYLERQKEYVSDNFDDVWTTEDCAEIIEAGEKLSPRFKEQFKEVCHAWYDKGIELEKQKEQKKSLAERFRPDFPTAADFIESVEELEKDKAIEILEDYLKWAVSSEEECSYTWNELADAIRLGIDAMKEKKPNIELIQKSWYMEGYHDRKFNNEPKWIIKTGEGGPRYEENPKYGKLIEKQDYSGLNDFERAIHRGFLCAGVENVPVNIIKEIAQDCLAHLSSEWSEEDEKVYDFIYDFFENCWWNTAWDISREQALKMLKSLRPPLKDREMKLKILKYLSTRCSSLEFEEIEDYFNNLRPSWKPSEEQMKALWDAYKGGKEQEPLRELIEQLKKLM